jgi:hypothetical protein
MAEQRDPFSLPQGAELSLQAQQEAAQVLQDPQNPKANVVGFAHGVKYTDNQPTGEPALLVLVNRKMETSQLPSADRVPTQIADIQTDVVPVGDLVALRAGLPTLGRAAAPADLEQRVDAGLAELERLEELLMPAPAGVSPLLLVRRMRPCPTGFSIGNVAVTAGTLGGVVYDFLPGASVNPPRPGFGTPSRYYVLSNNHILAASNAAPIGSAIVQPGPADGGQNPQDRIATLSRFVPIQFEPPIPRAQHNNSVDCAIGECSFQDATREIYFNGAPRGWRRRAGVTVGTFVRKTGRTTNMTLGRIIGVNATVDVNFGGGRVARFRDQILTTDMSAGGDSGSQVTDLDNNTLGLLFAGSNVVTVINHFENVRAALRVEIAERIG